MFEKQRLIPEPEEFIKENPLGENRARIKAARDKEIKDVLAGKSEKLLVIVGPCSAHQAAPTLEYAYRLGKLNEKVKQKLVLVPRIYTNKPRTKGIGYQGMFLQPDPLGEADIIRGIRATRALHLAVIDESGLTAADEMLYPENTAYVEDLLSYHTVGARSVENPLHRQAASGLDAPVGMKNPMSGNTMSLMNSIFAAQAAQVFKYRNYQVKSSGNEYAHAILRGWVNENGEDVANYQAQSVRKAADLYAEMGLKNPAIIIDCNHSNSGKRHEKQADIAREILQYRDQDDELKSIVKGLMIESFLAEGSQKQDCVFGQSITDPCMGWERTERLLLDIAERV